MKASVWASSRDLSGSGGERRVRIRTAGRGRQPRRVGNARGGGRAPGGQPQRVVEGGSEVVNAQAHRCPQQAGGAPSR
jgi:hypothetical protein